jgi:hypothetical protein
MYELPDGSGFFVAEIHSKRPWGLYYWFMCRPEGCVRRPIFFWRMTRDAYRMSRDIPSQGPPLSLWRCLRYAWSVTWP